MRRTMDLLYVILGVTIALRSSVSGMSLAADNETLQLGSSDVEDYNATRRPRDEITDLEFRPQQNYMNQLCNKKRLLHDRNAIVMSPWTTRHPPSTMACTVGVESYAYQNYRFVVTFKTMDMYSTTQGTCQRSRLDMFNGQSVSMAYLISDSKGLCGRSTEKKYYKTTSNFLTLRYATDNLPSSASQYFLAVITPFHYGTCHHDEFKCHNGMCIQNNMLCDSYNNCGDDSDEKHCGAIALSIAAIVGIVVGAVVLIVALIIICVCCNICCCACSAYESL